MGRSRCSPAGCSGESPGWIHLPREDTWQSASLPERDQASTQPDTGDQAPLLGDKRGHHSRSRSGPRSVPATIRRRQPHRRLG